MSLKALLEFVLFALLAYLIGSIPFSWFIARLAQVDLRRVGSGNIGATNVARSVGLPYGLLALILDAAKGSVPAYLALSWSVPIWLSGFAVIGHNWSAFLKFQGGKGVATSLGILLMLSPPVLVLTLTIWVLVAATTRYVSLASVWALLLSPLLLLLWGAPREAILLMAALGALSAFQHRSNFRRWLEGKEHKLS